MSVKEKKKLIAGRIILVQENRFRIADDEGRGYLFSLAHSTRTSQADLLRWHAADIRVSVAYEGEPNLASGIATRVHPLRQ